MPNFTPDSFHSQGVSIHSGFPNAGVDSSLYALDIARLLVPQPHSTYFMSVEGNLWADQGVFDGDIAIIDRSLQPRKSDIVVWWAHDNEFMLSTFTRVQPSCPVWGVVTSVVHRYRP